MKETISLSDGEWKLMNLLWEDSPRTVAQLVRIDCLLPGHITPRRGP